MKRKLWKSGVEPWLAQDDGFPFTGDPSMCKLSRQSCYLSFLGQNGPFLGRIFPMDREP
jgi:hypothetical protein